MYFLFFFLVVGLTFAGIKDGVADWSGCGNIKLVVFENAEKFQNYIESFNVNTNHWVAEYVFKRLKFMGNRNISHGATLLFLAVWHGFHSGYYMCFLMEFIVVHFEKEVRLTGYQPVRNVSPLILPESYTPSSFCNFFKYSFTLKNHQLFIFQNCLEKFENSIKQSFLRSSR